MLELLFFYIKTIIDLKQDLLIVLKVKSNDYYCVFEPLKCNFICDPFGILGTFTPHSCFGSTCNSLFYKTPLFQYNILFLHAKWHIIHVDILHFQPGADLW